MLEISFSGLNQIGDKVVAPFELDVDLRKSVFKKIAQPYEIVIHADGDNNDKHNNADYNKRGDHGASRSRFGERVPTQVLIGIYI
jgi:hypothetical protein